MADPVVIPVTALEMVQAIILAGTTPTPVPGTNLFMGYRQSQATDAGLIRVVLEGPDSDPEFTMGTVVALEHQRIDVIVYGNPQEYQAPKLEAMRIRYLVASQREFTLSGVRMLSAMPNGNIEPLGRDPLDREHFMVKFDVTLEPSYS